MDQSNHNWFSSVEAPIKVSGRDAVSWDESKDLVVVGFGGAGVATALQSLDNGLSVIALDKFAGGGATTINGAVVYAGCLLYTSPSPRDISGSRMPSSA